MAGNSFMSGLVSGFMAFGGGGAMGSMGGAGASAAGSPTGDVAMSGGGMDTQGTMANINNQTVTGPSANPGGSATNANAGAGNPPNTGGEHIGTTSQALTGDSGSSGSGDIIRDNPYGSGNTTPANKEPSTSDQFGKMMKDAGKQISDTSKLPDAHYDMTMPTGSAYAALFGTGPKAPGGQMGMGGMGGISAPAGVNSPTVQMPQMAPIAGPPQPSPLPMTITQPQPMIAPQLGAVSDQRAKTKIYVGNKDLEKMLDAIYSKLLAKGKR